MLLCENKQSYARKQKIYKGSQSPKNQEKLRNARLCNYDKSLIYLPRQHLPQPHVSKHFHPHGKKEQNLTNHFKIDSAATSREEIGNPPHYGTAGKLRQVGIPLIPHRAEQMTKADYDAYDYLIGMDSMNIRNIMRIIGKRYTKRKCTGCWIFRIVQETLQIHGTPAILTGPMRTVWRGAGPC